jgi:3-dehydroquinate dehydratase/shikimate dehydrogenase
LSRQHANHLPADPARVCAVITEETVDRARSAILQAAESADMIEVRLDYLRDFDFNRPEGLSALLEGSTLPAIITCRAVSEGGKQAVDDRVRLRLLVEGARQFADYCDIEAAFYAEAAKLSPDLSRLIISYHNFDETPSDLDSVYDRVCALPAAIHKIVTRANSVTDSLAIFHLLERARGEGRRLIALAMGQAGIATRVLGPSRGGYLTYGSLGSGRESASGQLSCEELGNLYRIHRISADTIVTGVIGNPVAHSASPAMHNSAFASLGLDYVYLPLEVASLREFFASFVSGQTRRMDWRLRGLSVTIPHKRRVMEMLDEVDETARRVGAVNTVVVSEGRLSGYNTDVEGAMWPLERVCALEGERCAVIGAGGSARAVIFGLLERRARVMVFARDPAKAKPIAEEFGVPIHPLSSFPSSDARVVINATPVGMQGYAEDQSPVPRAALSGRKVAYDLVYNPVATRFLQEATAEGCQTISGIGMLVAQAGLQFRLWTGKEPPLNLMRAAAIERVTAQASWR